MHRPRTAGSSAQLRAGAPGCRVSLDGKRLFCREDVEDSSPSPGSSYAAIAQLVERRLGMAKVAGSFPACSTSLCGSGGTVDALRLGRSELARDGFKSLLPHQIRPAGGNGRRTRFKNERRKACRIEACAGHQTRGCRELVYRSRLKRGVIAGSSPAIRTKTYGRRAS